MSSYGACNLIKAKKSWTMIKVALTSARLQGPFSSGIPRHLCNSSREEYPVAISSSKLQHRCLDRCMESSTTAFSSLDLHHVLCGQLVLGFPVSSSFELTIGANNKTVIPKEGGWRGRGDKVFASIYLKWLFHTSVTVWPLKRHTISCLILRERSNSGVCSEWWTVVQGKEQPFGELTLVIYSHLCLTIRRLWYSSKTKEV